MMPREVDVVDEYLTARRMLGLAADEIAGIAPKFLLHSATPQRLKAIGYVDIDAWLLNVKARKTLPPRPDHGPGSVRGRALRR